MNCDTVKTQFVDLLYEELDEKSTHLLQNHLASCQSCREEFDTLASTRQLLSAIPQEVPGERIVFTDTPRRSFAEWWRDFRTVLPQPAWARVSLGVATLVLFLLVGASISNFRMQYNEQGFVVSMSLFPLQEAQISPQIMATILAQARQENAQYTARLIAAERERQKQEWNAAFTNFALEMDRKQNTQLNLIGNEIERWNETTNEQFRQFIRSVNYPRR
jgi:predicted anti-sigma-YlaC factor YlaD